MNVKTYLGDLSGGGLLATESRIIAELLIQPMTEEQWKQNIIQDNILQKKSHQTGLRFANVIRRRFNAMGDDYIQGLLDVSDRAYIQLLLAGFLVQSPVIPDFMQNVLTEAKRTYQPEITQDAWMLFINDRIQAIPALAAYSESTLRRMGAHVIKALVDAEYLQSTRQRVIQSVYVLPEVESLLLQINQEPLIAVMECTQ